jgi:hypothetical protein
MTIIRVSGDKKFCNTKVVTYDHNSVQSLINNKTFNPDIYCRSPSIKKSSGISLAYHVTRVVCTRLPFLVYDISFLQQRLEI